MMFPSNITKDHLLKAIERIDLEGIPKNASSQFYDVLYNHKRYPPKVIVSFANIFANGTELDRNLFTGGIGTPCFQLLEKEGFKIVKKQKMINIKLYDIHGSSALENYKTLISPDKKWFYWDNKQFKKYNNGDVVFWINRKLRIALYTVINNNSIKPDFRDGRNYISDNGYEVSAAAQNKEQFETFIKFEVREFKEIEPDWNYTDPSTFQNQLMAYILFENKVKDIEKRKSKLKDLALIFNSGESNEVIMDALNQLGESINEPQVWFVTQGATFREDRGMKFLWAPEMGKDGNGRFYWHNVLKVKKGDIIFNYSEGELKGVSLAANDGYKAENKDMQSPWGPNGFRVDIDLTLLNPTLSSEIFSKNISSFNTHLSKINNKPFSKNGSINQGYLYEFSKKAGRYIRDLYNNRFGNQIIDEFFDKVKLSAQNNNNKMEESHVSILTAIKTKPFILLAGLSGTGKSRLVRTLAFKTCAKKELQSNSKKPGNFELITVRPNWHDSSELMGYISRINGEKYITTKFLQFIAKAWRNLDVPFFLCLDEMNLAPVEQYFAEYLSIVETRQMDNDEIATDHLLSRSSFENKQLYKEVLTELGLENDARFTHGISIPQNFIVIGTVNMDETTHSFSRKVLDRAMTFEMNEVDLNAGLDNSHNDWSYPDVFINYEETIGEFTAGSEVVNLFPESKKVISFLQNLNEKLEGSPFKIAYRVRDEFLIYTYYASLDRSNSNWLDSALDEMVCMKILSRIEGDESKTGEVLNNLLAELNSNFVKSNAKIKEMTNRLNSGYTSFWT